MTTLFGFTRTVIKERYALFSPDSFVTTTLPGWTGAGVIVLISPALGARFTQLLVTLDPRGQGRGGTGETELFAYVLEGTGIVSIDHKTTTLVAGSYAYIPPDRDYLLQANEAGARLLVFQRAYLPLRGVGQPDPVVKQEGQVVGLPFQGDADARLQTLLPDTPAHDMAVNIFTFQPGATLPLVESHVMEHGLLMLKGQGICRLDQDWHPVQAGDAIWMGPYCPQWFVAMGKAPASYIYYKDVNRAPRAG
jgi:(S)-ureidoglycine aminohydrolase